MAIKVTKRATNDGARYSISGLTFSQLFRIKNAMFDHEEKMKTVAEEMASIGTPAMRREFEGYAKDAHEVAVVANDACI